MRNDVDMGAMAGRVAPQSELTVELARELAWHCQLGYNDALIVNREEDVQCAVVRRGQRLILVFRGTERSVRDWRRNLAWEPVAFEAGSGGRGRVHGGYHAGVSCIWEELSGFVSLAQMAGWELVLTGHSAGGAMALDAAARLEESFRPLVVTFGAPGMGDRAFAASYVHGARTWRLEHDGDVVPWLLAWPFAEVGQCWFLPGDGSVVKSPSRWRRWWRVMSKVGRRVAHVRDHKIGAYVAELQKVMEVGV